MHEVTDWFTSESFARSHSEVFENACLISPIVLISKAGNILLFVHLLLKVLLNNLLNDKNLKLENSSNEKLYVRNKLQAC